MSQQKTQQARAREVEDYLISSLLGAKRRDREKARYDFTFEPQNQKIELKYSGPRAIRYSVGYTAQYQWTNIAARDFAYLLLVGEGGERLDYCFLDYWLLDAWTARNRFMTKGGGGMITFTPDGLRWRPKSYELEALRLNYEQLHALFQSEKLP